MKRLAVCLVLILTCVASPGCVLTKIATVPMRVVGAALSIVPLVGNSGHDAIDEAADLVDELPI